MRMVRDLRWGHRESAGGRLRRPSAGASGGPTAILPPVPKRVVDGARLFDRGCELTTLTVRHHTTTAPGLRPGLVAKLPQAARPRPTMPIGGLAPQLRLAAALGSEDGLSSAGQHQVVLGMDVAGHDQLGFLGDQLVDEVRHPSREVRQGVAG